jgi:hypothetical protein
MKAGLIGILVLMAGLVISSCGHTNNLADYEFRGKKAMFVTRSTTSGESAAVVSSPDDKSIVADIAAIIGSGILSDQSQRKLREAIDIDSIAYAVSRGMWESTVDYLGLVEVKDRSEDPDYLVETELREFKLKSSSSGLRARVRANSRIIDRRTGGIVWENSEAHTINLSNTVPAVLGPDVVRSGASVFNAVQLLNLDEEQIRDVMQRAGEVAGREIGETLREDVAEMYGK